MEDTVAPAGRAPVTLPGVAESAAEGAPMTAPPALPPRGSFTPTAAFHARAEEPGKCLRLRAWLHRLVQFAWLLTSQLSS